VFLQQRGGVWTTEVEDGRGGHEIWEVIRTPHFDEAIPGTTRFRHADSPNDTWYPCGGACCQGRPH